MQFHAQEKLHASEAKKTITQESHLAKVSGHDSVSCFWRDRWGVNSRTVRSLKTLSQTETTREIKQGGVIFIWNTKNHFKQVKSITLHARNWASCIITSLIKKETNIITDLLNTRFCKGSKDISHIDRTTFQLVFWVALLCALSSKLIHALQSHKRHCGLARVV